MPALRYSATAAIIAAALVSASGRIRASDASSAAFERRRAEIAENYGVDVAPAENAFELDGAPKAVGKPPGPRESERYAVLLARELSLYPKDLVKRARLKRIVLCSDLRYCDAGDPGRVCLGISSYDPPTIYLNISLDAWAARYACLTIHHELFHVIDNADDGVLDQDKGWSSFNPRGFKYAARREGDAADADRDSAPRGFASVYGTIDVAEDKAEVFAHLIVNGSHMTRRAETDPYLRAKIIAAKHALATFCPEVDETFWDAARRLERTRLEPVSLLDDAEEGIHRAAANAPQED